MLQQQFDMELLNLLNKIEYNPFPFTMIAITKQTQMELDFSFHLKNLDA